MKRVEWERNGEPLGTFNRWIEFYRIQPNSRDRAFVRPQQSLVIALDSRVL